jgi:phage terminase large subunit
VYGLGQLGAVEGKIYRNWQSIDEIPHAARLRRKGLEFGSSDDPSALVDMYEYNGGCILDNLLFQKGLRNKQIADAIVNTERALVIADSAEPKSLDEIKGSGVSIIGAGKGKDSVAHGIQLVQEQKISVTKHAVHIIKEYRHYVWMTDTDGKILNEPEPTFHTVWMPHATGLAHL